AYLSLPYLVGLGIDKGIRPGRNGNLTALVEIVGVLLVALVVNALANYAFLRVSGRLGADILFDLRRTLFAHVQELSLSFYARYTHFGASRAIMKSSNTSTRAIATPTSGRAGSSPRTVPRSTCWGA